MGGKYQAKQKQVYSDDGRIFHPERKRKLLEQNLSKTESLGTKNVSVMEKSGPIDVFQREKKVEFRFTWYALLRGFTVYL